MSRLSAFSHRVPDTSSRGANNTCTAPVPSCNDAELSDTEADDLCTVSNAARKLTDALGCEANSLCNQADRSAFVLDTDAGAPGNGANASATPCDHCDNTCTVADNSAGAANNRCNESDTPCITPDGVELDIAERPRAHPGQPVRRRPSCYNPILRQGLTRIRYFPSAFRIAVIAASRPSAIASFLYRPRCVAGNWRIDSTAGYILYFWDALADSIPPQTRCLDVFGFILDTPRTGEPCHASESSGYFGPFMTFGRALAPRGTFVIARRRMPRRSGRRSIARWCA